MSQVYVDPEEMERFAAALNAFLDDLQAAHGGLDHAFQALGETWRDEKRARFEEEYQALRQHLASFEASAREQVPYLFAQAAHLRDYLAR